MQHVPFSELDQAERRTRPAVAPSRLRFEHFADAPVDPFSPRPFIPVEAALPGDEQVIAAQLPGTRNVVDLDLLSACPSVQSVVAATEVRARTMLPSIRELLLDHGTRVPDDETLAHLPRLEGLWARWASVNRGLQIESLPAGSLRSLGIGRRLLGMTANRDDLEALGRLTELRQFVLRDCFSSDSVAWAASLSKLQLLDTDAPLGWPKLASCPSLTSVRAYRAKIDDLRRFQSWQGLRELTLSMGPLKSLDGVQAFGLLENLTLMGLRIDDVTPLAGSPALAHVRFFDLRNLVEIDALGDLPALRTLHIRGGSEPRQHVRVSTLSSLARLSQLESVVLEYVDLLDGSLMALSGLSSLRTVELCGLPPEQTARLKAARPDVEFKILQPLPARPVIAIGEVDISPPAPGSRQWCIYQDLSGLLGQPTNPDAEELLRLALVGVDRSLLGRLEFDSEAGAVGILATAESDIRAVAAVINELADSVRRSEASQEGA